MIQQYYEWQYRIFSPKIPPTYHEVLMQYSSYYQDLSPELKKLFLKRLYILIKNIRFVSEKNMTVNTQMKVLIGSAIIQITFGLKRYLLSQFKTIFVAPRKYTYKGMKHFIAGDVNPRNKIISLSWESVQKGFSIDDDAVNIALHEITHSIDFENRDVFINFFNDNDWHSFEQLAQQKILEIQKNPNSYLGAYAGQNIFELFARSIEFFFEKSEDLQKNEPLLFEHLQKLLLQNPLNKKYPIPIN